MRTHGTSSAIGTAISAGGVVIATGLWIGALALPMTSTGVGSSQSTRAFADLVRAGGLEPAMASEWGLWWYAVALLACAVLGSLAVAPRGAMRVIRAVVAIAVAASAVVLGLHLTHGVPGRLGTAFWCYLAGAAALLGSAAWPYSSRTTDSRPSSQKKEPVS